MPAKLVILKNDFPKIVARIHPAADGYDKATAEWGRVEIVNEMLASTPGPSAPGQPPAIDTGELAGSLQVEQIKPQQYALTTDAPYAPYLEYGTSNMAPRPFMTPAAQRMRGKQIELFSDMEKDLA